MLTVGQKVMITGPGDETFNKDFIGVFGVIELVDTTGGKFPVGQSKTHPLYYVKFPDDYCGGFWEEEMSLVKED